MAEATAQPCSIGSTAVEASELGGSGGGNGTAAAALLRIVWANISTEGKQTRYPSRAKTARSIAKSCGRVKALSVMCTKSAEHGGYTSSTLAAIMSAAEPSNCSEWREKEAPPRPEEKEEEDSEPPSLPPWA